MTAALPGQHGRRWLVTGANAGIGFFTSAALAGAGAEVVLAGRSGGRLEAAARAIRSRHADAALEVLVMDQSSLASVHAGADAVLAAGRLDGLVANAGMVHTPRRRAESVDGDELVLATNFLGHAALVSRLLPLLAASPGAAPSRIVSLGSLSTLLHRLDLDDPQLERRYTAWAAYARSKQLSEAFGFELDRRLRAAGANVASVVAHPGYSIGGRTPRVPGVNEPSRWKRFVDQLQAPFAQGKDRGAAPVVHAAIAAGVRGGDYWAPRFVLKGEPMRARPSRTTSDPETGRRVWAVAEQLVGEPIRLP